MAGDVRPVLRLDEVGVPPNADMDHTGYARQDGKDALVVRLEGSTRGGYVDVSGSGLDSPQLIVYKDDTTTAGKTYFGWAEPGTLTSAASWRIIQLDSSSGVSVPLKTFADGNADFDNIWDNRASLSYS